MVRVVLDNLNPTGQLPCTNLPSGRGPPGRQTAGVPLHPQARELVEYGGNRVQRAVLLPQAARPQRTRPPREVQALVTERNAARATINWRFNTQDARGKLASIPSIPNMTDY